MHAAARSVTQVGAAAEAARANFYIVPPDTSAVPAALLEGIENLAGVTAGARLALASTAETALGRVARETSGYYVATFAPDGAERDGLNHRVEVRVGDLVSPSEPVRAFELRGRGSASSSLPA